MIEQSLFMVKPDGVSRGLIGEILSRVEKKGYKIRAMKMLSVDDELASRHYAEHRNKPFYDNLVAFITSGPSVAMLVEGDGVIMGLRELVGKTNPEDAAEGTIRRDFGASVERNVVHASDSPASAEREIPLFFNETEIQS
ncbi:MAG: nucleoside-diphosphate kinase [Candidatus Hydrothermarchaeales archaeon]